MAALAYGFGALAVFLLLDGAFLELGAARALPWFAPAAAAFTGFLISVVWYFDIRARQRAKKHRKKALAAMCADLVACILAVLYVIVDMVKKLI